MVVGEFHRVSRQSSRRRAFGLLMIPFAGLVWSIGWSLCWIGEAARNTGFRLALPKDEIVIKSLLLPKLKLEPAQVAFDADKTLAS